MRADSVKPGMLVKHKGYVNYKSGVYDWDDSQPFKNYGLNSEIVTDRTYTVDSSNGNSLYLVEIPDWTFHVDEFIRAAPRKKGEFFFD